MSKRYKRKQEWVINLTKSNQVSKENIKKVQKKLKMVNLILKALFKKMLKNTISHLTLVVLKKNLEEPK